MPHSRMGIATENVAVNISKVDQYRENMDGADKGLAINSIACMLCVHM